MNTDSSQERFWIFSSKTLNEKRSLDKGAARERVILSWKEEEQLQGSPIPVVILTPKEEEQLLSWYQIKIRDYAKFFKFDKHIEATALILFKRFYISNSLLEHDPKKILMSCIFLATKIEHHTILLDDFLAKIPKSPKHHEMVDLELTISTSLNFEYMVHHPYWPLHGLFLDFQTFITETIAAEERQAALQSLYTCYTTATSIVPRAYLTDAPFLYSPSQLALACLLLARMEVNVDIEGYLLWHFKADNVKIEGEKVLEKAPMAEPLLALTSKISAEIESHLPIEKGLAKELALKAESCFSRDYCETAMVYRRMESNIDLEVSVPLISPF